MLILKVEEKVTHSEKTGKDYYSYNITGADEETINDQKVLTKRFVKLSNSSSIQEYLAKGVIKSYKDLEGKHALFARKYPVYLDQFEKQNCAVQHADLMLIQSK